MLTAITGINWGDEGKGRMVDLISQEYDIVARYQGGNNAGHTVKNERGKFVLNLLPSGILRPNVVCVMGNGMVIDPHHLDGEINKLREQGVEISPANLKISDRATITMPYHVEQDGLEEARLSKTGAQFGSTKRGIAYAYGRRFGLPCHPPERRVQRRGGFCCHSTGRPERAGERRSGMGAPGTVQGPQHHHGAAHHRGAHRSGPCTQPH